MGTEAPLFGAIWRNPFVGSECDVIQMKKRFHLDDKPEDFLKKKIAKYLLFELSSFEGFNHRRQSSRPIIVSDVRQVEIKVKMNEVSLQPGLEVMIRETSWRIGHAL